MTEQSCFEERGFVTCGCCVTQNRWDSNPDASAGEGHRNTSFHALVNLSDLTPLATCLQGSPAFWMA